MSRRFVPVVQTSATIGPVVATICSEPVEMTYIVTDTLVGCYIETEMVLHGTLAGLPSAIAHFIRDTPWLDLSVRMACGDERICSICVYGVAEIHPVRQVTLQTRLRRPFWPNTEAFRVFISDRLVIVNRLVCSNCLRRCNKPNVPGAGWCRCPQPGNISRDFRISFR